MPGGSSSDGSEIAWPRADRRRGRVCPVRQLVADAAKLADAEHLVASIEVLRRPFDRCDQRLDFARSIR